MSHKTFSNSWALDPGECDVKFKISEKGKMRLIFPVALLTMTQAGLREVFALMCRWEYDEQGNRDALRTTRDEIPRLLVQLKQEWDAASVKYQREYKLGRGHAANNKMLLNDVKRAKRAYDRMVKVRAIFAETLEKFRLQDYLEEAQS